MHNTLKSQIELCNDIIRDISSLEPYPKKENETNPDYTKRANTHNSTLKRAMKIVQKKRNSLQIKYRAEEKKSIDPAMMQINTTKNSWERRRG